MNIHANLSVRANVILTLEKIHQGQSLSFLLDELLNTIKGNEKAFAHELLLGVLRQWHAINRIGESLIKQPPSDNGVICALNMGLYELLYMNTPDYALINETLNAVKEIHKNYGVGLINAILRKIAKDKEKFFKKINKNHSLPNWLAKQLKIDWGEYYQILGENLRKSAPIFLRPNCKFCSVVEYSNLLTNNSIHHQVISLGFDNYQCIELLDNIKIDILPKFNQGFISIQDRHAQLSAHLIQKLAINKDGVSILDACAAPGGKTAHLLECLYQQKQKFELIAIDSDKKRVSFIHDNLQRLQLLSDNIKILAGDARTFCDDEKFDIILLDAPCTATGVIRRHPDINLLRTEKDVIQTVKLQADILDNLWLNLNVGGYLLYITCSLLKAENENQLMNFLTKHPNAKVVEFELLLSNQVKREIGYQCLPLNNDDGDGFYYALLQKIKEK